MVKRRETIKDRLQISRKRNPAYTDKLRKIEKFLNETMQKHKPMEHNLSIKSAMARLELINKHAKRIFNAVHMYNSIQKGDLSDCEITFDEISNHKREMMLELKNHAHSMVILLENEHFPSLNAVISEIIGIYIKPENTIGRKIIIPSLANRLKHLINKIDETVPTEVEIEPMKKGKGPFRFDLIRCLAETWPEITEKPIPKLKRNRVTGKLYGEFHDFIKESLELAGIPINTEESLKDIQKYSMGKLVPNKNQ